MRILVYGVVQGVGFRPTVYNIAKAMGLRGYIRNNGANVEIVIDGNPETFLGKLREGLPPLARLERVEIEGSDDVDLKKYPAFRILPSSPGARSSVIPADTALCENCLRELRDGGDRRHGYPFINCTDCGARYSLIADLPYDRPKTSMVSFPMCNECQAEYGDPGNRRFHAQTTACPACGPRFTLYDADGTIVRTDQEECFREFARRLEGGEVGVMKSWGGMHICSGFGGVERLRRLYRRPQKPFAVMMRDMAAVRKIASPTSEEEDLLVSRFRPIVLVGRSNDDITEPISPGLDSIGVMLPYSPAHFLLFDHYGGDGIVATSANLPGEPICSTNERAFSLGLDCYLLHDRDIVQRVDDSVARFVAGHSFFVRKSRSYVPDPLPALHAGNVLAVGAEENVTTAVSKDRKIFNSQYIGKTRNYDTFEYLMDATDHMLYLLGLDEMDVVVRDEHPRYATRRAAELYAERFGCGIVDVQHHWAHGASLALEHGLEEQMVVLALDGSGYGPDGTIWGGEILRSDLAGYERVGRLQHIPLLGGEKAIYDPRRLVLAVSELTGYREIDTGLGDAELNILRKLMDRSILTSSCGRVLDALSAYLGICSSRTYDGEPAMKLEKYLGSMGGEGVKYDNKAGDRHRVGGGDRYKFEVPVRGGKCSVIETLPAFGELFGMGVPDEMKYGKKCDLARSFVGSIMDEMVRVAAQDAQDNGIEYVGVTGGVSYNRPIVEMIVERMKEYPDLKLLLHGRVPNGDGGIAVGQNAIGGRTVGS